MFYTSKQPRYSALLRFFFISCCVFTLLLFISPHPALAAPTTPTHDAANGPSIQSVSIGFNGKYQDQNWVPVQISLANNGASDFTGTVSVNTPSAGANYGDTSSNSRYQTSIDLPPGTPKQITLYVPFSTGSQGNQQSVVVNLLDSNGLKVASKTSSPTTIGAGVLYIGILSDLTNSFGAISQVSPQATGSSVSTEPLTAANLPDNAAALANFDMLIFDNFTTSNLSKDQITAIQNWVDQGGSLVVVGGPEWRRTLSPLPTSLLPVTITGTDTLSPGTHLLPIGASSQGGPSPTAPADTVSSPVPVTVATPQSAATTVTLSSGSLPLIVYKSLGQGSISYLAFDPALSPLFGWSNTTNLWTTLIVRSLADHMLSNTSSSPGGFTNNATSFGDNMNMLLQSFIPSTYPATWLILALLFSYVLILGPIRLLILRRIKKRSWSWRIVLSTIVVFSLLSYGLALHQKGSSIVSSRITVVQLDRPGASSGSTAHATTYLGVYVPNQGNFHVHVPGANLVQPDDLSQYASVHGQSSITIPQTTITSAPDGTDVDLQGVEIWTLRSLMSTHDFHTSGGIISHLTLQQNTVSGTVTNTLPYALNDAYVLLDSDYVALGTLAAGQSLEVNLSLKNSLNVTTGSNLPLSLADQIAADHHFMPNQYNPTTASTQSQDPLHRHMSVLTTLSGEGFYCGGPCYGHTVVTKGVNRPVITNSSLNTSRDPLLLPGAAATVIGWADSQADPTDALTVNGNTTNGTHDTLIQAPLDLQYSGSLTIPPDLVPSQIVDVQQNQSPGNIQEPSPSIYTMTTGSMTFEFTLPTPSSLQHSSFTLTAYPNALNMARGFVPAQGTGPTGDITHLHAYLYNWQTHKWDTLLFNSQFSLSVADAQPYTSSNGRIILQLANQDTALGTTIFSKPSLLLQGTVPH